MNTQTKEEQQTIVDRALAAAMAVLEESWKGEQSVAVTIQNETTSVFADATKLV